MINMKEEWNHLVSLCITKTSILGFVLTVSRVVSACCIIRRKKEKEEGRRNYII